MVPRYAMVVYRLQKVSGKSGRKVNGTYLFWLFQRNISESNGTSVKVVLFFRTEYSKRKFAFHFFQAIFNTREGATSDSFDLRFGVPQGSCLGPLLFVVQASKLSEIVQDHLPNAHCFADDTQLYLSFNPNSPTDQAMALEAMERCISDLRHGCTGAN